MFAFESLWLAAATVVVPGAPERVWRVGFVSAHAALYAFALAEHQFFLHTGTRLDLALVGYALGNLDSLAGPIASGADRALLPRAGLAALFFALGWANLRNSAPGTSALSTAVAAAGIVLGLGIVVAVPAPHGEAAALATRGLAGLVRPARPTGLDGDAWLAANVQPIYDPPRLLDARPARRQNVVLVILESTRADVVPPWAEAGRGADAPFLAGLARRAVVFDSVYTSVPHTSKALVGLLCGMYPMLRMPIVESVPGQLPLRCLPTLLRRLGYRTAFFQSARGSFEDRPGLTANLGFETTRVQEDWPETFAKTGYFGMDEFAMLEPALRWISERPEQPFFATLLSVTPHHPYQVPGEAAAPDDAAAFAAYLRAVGYVDRFVGALHARLSERDLLDETLFIVVGDHGEAFGEHLRRQHDVVPYEEGVRVPLYLAGPAASIGPPRRVGGLRHHLDLLPTILELVGARFEGQLPGRSLLSSEGHGSVISSCWYTDWCLSLRTADLHLVYHYGRRPTEIFDLASDPRETRDLAGELPAALRDSLVRQLLAQRFSIDAWYIANAPGKPDRPIDRE
jgi:arylsulfatase A-like enzyme